MSDPRLSIYVLEYAKIYGEELQVIARSTFYLGMFHRYTGLLSISSNKLQEDIAKKFQTLAKLTLITNVDAVEVPAYLEGCKGNVICTIGVKQISNYNFEEFPEVNAYFKAYAEKPNVSSVVILVWN